MFQKQKRLAFKLLNVILVNQHIFTRYYNKGSKISLWKCINLIGWQRLVQKNHFIDKYFLVLSSLSKVFQKNIWPSLTVIFSETNHNLSRNSQFPALEHVTLTENSLVKVVGTAWIETISIYTSRRPGKWGRGWGGGYWNVEIKSNSHKFKRILETQFWIISKNEFL